MTKLDASQLLKNELNKLLLTAPASEIEVSYCLIKCLSLKFDNYHILKSVKSEFIGFERIFKRYLEDEKAEIDWSKIEPLHKTAVKCLINKHSINEMKCSLPLNTDRSLYRHC